MERGIEVACHVGGGCSRARRRRAVDAKAQLRGTAFESRVQVHQSRHVVDAFHHLLRLGPQGRVVVAEDLDLDGPWGSRQVVEHVLQHLNVLGARLRHVPDDLRAHLRDHLVGGTVALRTRLQADHDVATVDLRRGDRAKLGPGPSRIGSHLGGRRENGLDLARHRIGLAKRRPGRQEIVEHEGALVHGRQESRRGFDRRHRPQPEQAKGDEQPDPGPVQEGA